jgi:hypothetical protein
MGTTENINSLQAQIKQQLQEREKELEATGQRKTELGHDITRRTAEYLESSDLPALRETSKDGESAVTSLGPSQPYLQKCAAPCVFGVLPSESSRFTEGCQHLWKNILGLFSAVIVMANNFNNCETQFKLINARVGGISFDIQDHTAHPTTIFKYEDALLHHQSFTWNEWEKKFSHNSLQNIGRPVYLDQEECVKAIEKHWAGRLPPSPDMVKPELYSKKGFWAPVIAFWWLDKPGLPGQMEALVQRAECRQMDTQMETALKSAGTLAQRYSFITNHMYQRGFHLSRYTLFHHALDKKGNALLPPSIY